MSRLTVYPVLQACTLASLRGEKGVTGADNPQRDQLTREMLRYIRGRTGGRAVLVSGHRGVGKTSLVMNAVQRARDDLAGTGLRPLLVRLDAPSLFMPDPRPGGGETGSLNRDVETVLRRVAIALFQSMEDEIWRAMLERVRQGDLPGGMSAEELTELAARLRAELTLAPTLADLRDLWRRAGLLEGGGLFGAPHETGHGIREVLAIWAAVRAHHVAGDTVVDTAEQDREQKASAERSRQTRWAMRELLNPLVGLMSGALVGAGMLNGGSGGLLAAITGTLTTVITGVTLDVTVKHFREEKQVFTYKVTKDTTPYALTRLLPQLVTQLRETGLAPIFVVDELDKVKGQRDRLDALVGRLKSFVAEDAFFCFLTDRDYYELLAGLAAAKAWPAAAAAFSDRLFVCYRPQDLRRFLEQLIRGPTDASGGESALTPDEILERDLVITGLLGRSRGHLQDLHRILRALTDEDGRLKIPAEGPGENPTWLTPALFQVCVEHALALPALASRTQTDSYLLQQAFDAISWAVRSWERGDLTLDLTLAGLRTRLTERMDLSELGADDVQAPLSDPDLELLFAVLVRLCDALAAPSPPQGCQACVGGRWRRVLVASRDEDIPAGTRRYSWVCDPWGRERGIEDDAPTVQEGST